VTDFGRRTAAHKASHQDGGSDEISVAALSGELADNQPGKTHGLGGVKHSAATLAQLNAKVSDATLDKTTDTRPPLAHKASHQSGGGDAIACTGLVGRINYVDRGDPSAFDWQVGNLTTDNLWHDLDCGAIVPAGAVAIQFRLDIQDDDPDSNIQMRKKGNAYGYACWIVRVRIAASKFSTYGVVFCDASRVVEYKTKDTIYDVISIVVLGWFV